MQTITGQDLDVQSIAWTAPRGEVKITVVRNARLSTNGYITASTHSIALTLAGNQAAYRAQVEHPEHGYCLEADMGRLLVRVPADKAEAVRALLTECEQHNAAVLATEIEADAAYAKRSADVERLRTTGRM